MVRARRHRAAGPHAADRFGHVGLARLHRLPRVDDQIDQGEAQPLGVGRDLGRRPIERERHRRAGRDLRRGRRVPAERVDIGRRQLETNRPGEVEHVVDDAVEPHHFAVDVRHRFAQRDRRQRRLPQAVQRRLDDHQRVAHFVRDDRRQPSERRQPLLLRHLALRPGDRLGQRVERRRQQPRVFIVPAPSAAKRDLARQIAGRRDLSHDRGDRGERAGDGPRHARSSGASPAARRGRR